MSKTETITAVSDVHPTIHEALEMLRRVLNEELTNISKVFENAGKQLWSADSASHTVTPVQVAVRRPQGLIGHQDVWETHYVASAILMVTYQERLD